jgi:hypothetical protein
MTDFVPIPIEPERFKCKKCTHSATIDAAACCNVCYDEIAQKPPTYTEYPIMEKLDRLIELLTKLTSAIGKRYENTLDDNC